MESFKFNVAIGSIMQLTNDLMGYSGAADKNIFGEGVKNILLLLSPFAPHLSEELWEKAKFSGKFISVEKWPVHDEKLIDVRDDAIELFLDKSVMDLYDIKELLKITKPNKISFYISEKWKYALYKMKNEMKNTRDVGVIMKEIMKDPEMRKRGKEVSAIVPTLVNNPEKIPLVVLDQETELKALESIKEKMQKVHDCTVEILPAEKSQSPRARKAMPGKPGIEVQA
jgi:leucyl-tRNA synthetase